ncbi:MAG: hypothetical protein RIF33_02725 [Cyclobacteriaceae bacterium]
MKTEIIDTYSPQEGFMINKVLPVNQETHVILMSKLSPDYTHKAVIEIKGALNRKIDVSGFLPEKKGIVHQSIFAYKKGFGLRDHGHSLLLLWGELEQENPTIIHIEQSPHSEIEMRKNSLAFASYDESDNTILIGINDNKGSAATARYWASLQFLEEVEKGNEISLEWNEVHELDAERYPPTYYHGSPLEWLGINDIIQVNEKKYIYSIGGGLSRMRSGPQYEFSILSVLDKENNVIKNIDVEEGKRSFSADKKYFMVRPAKKKRLLIYDLETLEINYNIPLKADQNLGSIDGNIAVSADLYGNRLYVYTMSCLNICQLIE